MMDSTENNNNKDNSPGVLYLQFCTLVFQIPGNLEKIDT